MNVIVWRNPHFFRTLPCLWNIQLNDAAVYSYCPFEWLKKSAINAARKIKALHMNRASKADYYSDEEYYQNNAIKVVNNCEFILHIAVNSALLTHPMAFMFYFLVNDLFRNFQIERWKVHETNIHAFRESGPNGKTIDQKYISVSKKSLW